MELLLSSYCSTLPDPRTGEGLGCDTNRSVLHKGSLTATVYPPQGVQMVAVKTFKTNVDKIQARKELTKEYQTL